MRDYFALFDLPRTVNLDVEALQRAFHARSRKVHPDLYQGSLPRVQQEMLRSSMALNEAYQVLRDRRRRLEHLLALESPRRPENRSQRVPMELFDVVEQVHEHLAAYRTASDEERLALAEKLHALRRDASAAADAIWQTIAAVGNEWDANENAYERAEITEETYQARKKPLLEQLERLSDELAYAERLLLNVDQALDGERDAPAEKRQVP